MTEFPLSSTTNFKVGKKMVQVKNILGDDVYGLWHVKKFLVNKEGRRYVLIPNKEVGG